MAKHIPLSRASREAERVIEAFGGPMADASAGLANVEGDALEAVDRLVGAAGGIEKASRAWSRVALDVPLDGDERSLADVVDEQLDEMERIARAGGGRLDREGARGQMGRAYAAMLNLLLYVIHEEEDAEVVYAPAKQGKGRRPGRRSNPETIELVGARMGRALGEARRVASSSGGVGSKKAPHLRRGHWAAYWLGARKGRTDGRHGDELVLRWIPPIEVNGGGIAVETVHRG